VKRTSDIKLACSQKPQQKVFSILFDSPTKYTPKNDVDLLKAVKPKNTQI